MASLGKLTIAAVLCIEEVGARNQGYKDSTPWLPRVAVPGAVSADLLVAAESLPASFDWRDVNGKNLVTTDWNQHIPVYCGACWIHGTTSALNDRIKVMRGGKWPDVMLGRQTIMDCVPNPKNASAPPPGCDGGDAYMIHQYLMNHKVPDETCMPYQAKNMACDASDNCRNCVPGDGGCFPIKKYNGYGVKTYGYVSGEVAMMKEIYARGPISCSFATDQRFMFNYPEVALANEGVYVSNKTFTVDEIDHVMEVAGWGTTPSGLKYWIIRNSWGTYWGDAGWLKLARGVNDSLCESQCDWAVPTFDDLDGALEGRVLGDYRHGDRTVSEILNEQALSSAPASAPTSTTSMVAAVAIGLAAAGAALGRAFLARSSLQQQPLLG
jgi:cathepsin X